MAIVKANGKYEVLYQYCKGCMVCVEECPRAAIHLRGLGYSTTVVTWLMLTEEPDETFHVVLSNPSGATIAKGTGVGTIIDDDGGGGGGTPQLSISDAQVTEGNSGSTIMTFTVTLSPAATGAVSVRFTSADGTAVVGSDYVQARGMVSFNPGETEKTIEVTVIGDTTPEPDETFFINLSRPSGATIADGQGVGTILNDD